MKFHWMKDRILQKQFRVYWDKGVNNWADYFTKHHPPKHHKLMRPKYIQMKESSKLRKEYNSCKGVFERPERLSVVRERSRD